jgi:cytochrome P450
MHMLLRPYDERFKLHQKLEAPVLNERTARAYVPIQDLESKQLLFDLLQTAGRPVNCHDHVERMTASTIYTLFYSHRVRTAADPILLQAHAVNHEFDQLAQVGKYLVDSFPILNHLPAFLAPWKAEAAAHWQQQRALHVGNLSLGLASRSTWNVTKQLHQTTTTTTTTQMHMPTDELALDIGIMADAALDASTETLMWFILACITTSPSPSKSNWLTTAHTALDTTVGRARLPTLSDRPALPYISAVVDELLRWRPAGAAGVPHYTKTGASYGGFRIPANSVVIANHWSIAREEGVFGADVEAFVPERWLVDGDVRFGRDELPTVGFGYGRRICPGRHVARNGLWLAVARVLWAFEVRPEVDGTGEAVQVDMKGTDGLVTKPLPFKARFVPRGEWVRDIVGRECDTWGLDYHEVLDQIGARVSK